MFTVLVNYKKDGKPVKNKKVSVIFSGLLRGCARDRYTDSIGEAHFTEDNGRGTIFTEG